MIIPNDILVFFYLVWFIVLFFWLIRKGIEPLWKILPLIIFVFYIWKNYTLFLPVWKSLQADYIKFLIDFTVYSGSFVFNLLPYVWAVILVVAFYMVNEIFAEKMVKVMVYITVFAWTVWLINLFFGDKIGPFLRKEIPNFLP